MGKFSDNIQKRLRNKDKQIIEFACQNCLTVFTYSYSDICLNKLGDVQFTPEPECTKCGATKEIIFTDFSQEKIEYMLTYRLIKTCPNSTY